MNLGQLSRLCGYLSLVLLIGSVFVILFALATLWANELMATLVYWALIAAFGCFAFWAERDLPCIRKSSGKIKQRCARAHRRF